MPCSGISAHYWCESGGRRGRRTAEGDGVNVAVFLELEEEVVELGCGGEGGEAEAGFGGVLEVGASVGEEDEGHGR